MIKIDKKDINILSILDMNARIPISQLTKKTGISRQVAEYRINKLKKERVIFTTIAVYDQKVAGKNIYRVIFQLYTINNEGINKFTEYLKDNYSVMWFAKIGGGWDLIVNFLAEDTYKFDKLFMQISNEYSKIIQNYIILQYINIYDLPKRHIYEKENNHYFFHEMGDNKIKLDNKDKEIIKLLGKDCRLSNLEIGKKVGLTGNAIKYRIKQYLDNKLLLGFRALINPEKLGYQNFIVFFIINNLSFDDEKRFINYLKIQKNITFIVKHIGEYRIGIEIETKNVADLEIIMREIRTKFNNVINDIKIFPVLEESIHNYVP